MFPKINLKYIAFLFLALTLSSCAQVARSVQLPITPAQAASAEQLPNTSAQTVISEQLPDTSAPADPVVAEVATQAESTNKLEAKCIRNSDQTQLLMSPVQGYCLQYPTGYDIALLDNMKIMLVKRTPLNSADPNLFVNVDPANGMTVEQFADKLTADYSVPGLEVTRTVLEIDQERAIVLDGLTGQDPNRHVVVVHNDRLYHMLFNLMEDTPEVRVQAEMLFNTVIQSFSLHPETNLCPDCPPTSETP